MGAWGTLATQSAQESTATSAQPSPRLVNAAHEFEASLMKELMAPLEPGHNLLDGEDEEGDSSSALSEFASEALGKAISEQGGLGIASSILHQLAPGASHSGSNHSGKPVVPSHLIGIPPSSSSK